MSMDHEFGEPLEEFAYLDIEEEAYCELRGVEFVDRDSGWGPKQDMILTLDRITHQHYQPEDMIGPARREARSAVTYYAKAVSEYRFLQNSHYSTVMVKRNPPCTWFYNAKRGRLKLDAPPGNEAEVVKALDEARDKMLGPCTLDVSDIFCLDEAALLAGKRMIAEGPIPLLEVFGQTLQSLNISFKIKSGSQPENRAPDLYAMYLGDDDRIIAERFYG